MDTSKSPGYFNVYRNIFRIVDLVAIAALISLFLIGVYTISTYNPHVWVDLICDDAYYYLGVARSIAQGLGSSFLPPFHTNGYQPLWMLVLVSTSNIFGVSDRSLVLQMYCLSFLFVAFFAYLSKKHYGYFFPAIALSLTYPSIGLVGMETTMLPSFVILFFSSRDWAKRGCWSSLVFLTRLDALALVIARDIYVYFRDRKNDFRHYFILIPVAVFYCLANYYFFDVFFPISGLAKSVGNIKGENISLFMKYLSGLWPIIFFIPITCIIFLNKKNYSFRYKDELASCLLALLICATYYSVNSGWWIWSWYLWPVFMLVFYCCLETINYYFINLGMVSSKNKEVSNKSAENLVTSHGSVIGFRKKGIIQGLYNNFILFVVALTFACVFYSSIYFHATLLNLPYNKYMTWGKRNVELVGYFKRNNIPKNTFFLMGDRAGSFGFFMGSDFRFLHAEGLVSSTGYYRSMVEDNALKFIDQLPIDFFIVERENFLKQDDVIGIVEPVQGLSSHFGPWLICFNRSDILLDQSYYYQKRYIFEFKKRIQCPANMVTQFLELKATYGGIRKFSLPSEYYKGQLQRLLHLPATNSLPF